MMDIAGKTFLVTGGASGLGAACVRRLAERGGNVVIADLNEGSGEPLARNLGASVRFVHTDVTDDASTRAAIAVATGAFSGLHGAVHCAGVVTAQKVLGKSGPHSLEAFAKVITINLVGTFNVSRLAADAMSRNPPDGDGERGVIINTASIAAFEGQIGQAAYAASKGGVASMTLPLSRELARHGIRVMAIAPGIFDTPLLASLPEAARKSLAEQVPFPARLGAPDEFAALVEHIVQNRMLNGAVLRLDGALRMT